MKQGKGAYHCVSVIVPVPIESVLAGIVGLLGCSLDIFSAVVGSLRCCLELACAGSSIGFKFISRLCKNISISLEQAHDVTKHTFPCWLQLLQHLPCSCQHRFEGLEAPLLPNNLNHFAAAAAAHQ